MKHQIPVSREGDSTGSPFPLGEVLPLAPGPWGQAQEVLRLGKAAAGLLGVGRRYLVGTDMAVVEATYQRSVVAGARVKRD